MSEAQRALLPFYNCSQWVIRRSIHHGGEPPNFINTVQTYVATVRMDGGVHPVAQVRYPVVDPMIEQNICEVRSRIQIGSSSLAELRLPAVHKLLSGACREVEQPRAVEKPPVKGNGLLLLLRLQRLVCYPPPVR